MIHLFYFIRYQAATASSSVIYHPPRPGIRSHYSAGQGVSVGSPYSGFTKERGNRMRKLRAKEKYRFSRKILYCHIGNRATIRPYKEMKLLSDTTTYFGQRNSRRLQNSRFFFSKSLLTRREHRNHHKNTGCERLSHCSVTLAPLRTFV